MGFINKDQMIANEYIKMSRAYLDYLEEHIENIRLAFDEVSRACDGMAWVGDDFTWHMLRDEVCMHDVSKFYAKEFVQYRMRFYPIRGEVVSDEDFDRAWKHHFLQNNHHWESIEHGVDGDAVPGRVEANIVHMIVDWTAMGYKFGDTAQAYFEANKKKIQIDEKWIPFMYEVFNRIGRKR